jgi:hypothetical protein
VVWCLLALAAVVGVEVLGLHWFYARQDPGAACHCDQPWRGEYIANFGHPPEAVRWAPRAPQPLARPFRMPRWRHRRGLPIRPGGARPAPAA